MKPCCEQYLNEQFGGDADIVCEIYSEYVASLREKVAEANSAFLSRDWVALDRAAHAVKGNALTAGDTETAQVAIQLRSAAKLEDIGECEALIAGLASALETL